MPQAAGLVIPWITPRRDNGQHLLGAIDQARADHAIRRYLCGVCGRPLRGQPDDSTPARIVLLMRGSDLASRCTVEPALHPQCAAYTATACPMVAGRSAHYRRSPHPVDDTMVVGSDLERRLGAPAESWFAIWLTNYEIGVRNGLTVASYQHIEPLRIRPIGRSAALLDLLVRSLPETLDAETSRAGPQP
ncbi:hypothetical protein [Labedaea rhizosphaerae]|nr:hypothetical protein [Labedaea rhizosphaerae]